MNTPKQVLFRGEKIDVTEAREMFAELGAALSAADPDLSDFPAGKEIPAVMNPVWYTEMARAPFEGSMVSFRDPALGWRAFLIPWPPKRRNLLHVSVYNQNIDTAGQTLQ